MGMEYGNGKTNQLTWQENANRYHNQKFNVDANNLNVNVAMLSHFVDKEDRVLDFGCGEGKFGAVLKDNRKLLVGVDLDEVAATYAKEHYGYDEIFIFNLENNIDVPEEFSIYSDDNNKFDVIMLLDVLEHLINPSDIVSKLVKYLKNKGRILVSVPNVNNADIFLNLLRDHFNYREAGVLDNTHVKYFTKTSFVEWVGEMNELYEWSLDCEYVGSVYAYTDYLEEVKNDLPAVYNFVQLNPYFHVMQHLFVLTFFDTKNDTPQLNQLLSEQPEDLACRLNNIIAKSGSASDMADIKMLSNERKIMEDQYNVAQKGWEECSEALKQLRGRTEEKEKDNLELRGALEHSNKDNVELREALEHSNKDNVELREALEHSNKDNVELREALEHSNKDNAELREALEQLNNEYCILCEVLANKELKNRSILSRLKDCRHK